MIKQYKLPKQNFDLLDTLKALAQNKHNDITTTYYLMHKKWVLSPEFKQSDLVKISVDNYEMIAHKMQGKDGSTKSIQSRHSIRAKDKLKVNSPSPLKQTQVRSEQPLAAQLYQKIERHQ